MEGWPVSFLSEADLIKFVLIKERFMSQISATVLLGNLRRKKFTLKDMEKGVRLKGSLLAASNPPFPNNHPIKITKTGKPEY